MKVVHAALGLILLASCANDESAVLPIESGTYQFQHRDAEFPQLPSFPVTVRIDGHRFEITANKPGDSATMCELYAGTVMWNDKVHKWVLGNDASDRTAEEAGGCQDKGPDVIDFKDKTIWTCVGEAIVTEACSFPSK